MSVHSVSRIAEHVDKQQKTFTNIGSKAGSEIQMPHENDRRTMASGLGLTLERFDALVASGNQAFQIMKDLGPFYGREEVSDPTFRISAEPIPLPKGSKERFEKFGDDLLAAGKALEKLPHEFRQKLGDNLDFRLPFTWRIDAIIGEDGKMVVNEIEALDGASALMIAEQLSYGLQTLEQSTAAQLMRTIRSFCVIKEDHVCKVAVIWPEENISCIPNLKKLCRFVRDLSQDRLLLDLRFEENIREGQAFTVQEYHGVINESFFTTQELLDMGVGESQIYSSGYYNTIVNKGFFALVFDPALENFWLEHIGRDRLARLQDVLIPTHFIETVDELEDMRSKGKVVKVSWVSGSTTLLDDSAGVAVPDGDIKHNSDERWETIKHAIQQKGVRVIAQDYVRPARIPAFLRKKGTNLEKVEWYNRVCLKYVCEGNPNIEGTGVRITAAEVTLGPSVVPAGRANCFTAGKFID